MKPAEYKQIRKELGLLQKDLAEKLGVSRKTITDRERGAVKITEEAALAIHQISSDYGQNAQAQASPEL